MPCLRSVLVMRDKFPVGYVAKPGERNQPSSACVAPDMSTIWHRGVMASQSAAVLLPAALLVLASGCGGDDAGTATDPASVTLRVETQDWTGWQKQQPSPEVTAWTITEGSGYDVMAVGGPITFTVVEVGADHVELETDGSLVVDSDGGIDFDEATTHFTLDGTTPLELSTPTMDAGTHIVLTRD